jgi:arylsulfatase A-like enzyme
MPGMRMRSALALAAAASALVLGLSCGRPKAPGGPPNLLLVSIDTLRADHLGLYGYDRPTSPRIDAFAQGALVFERALSHASETRASVSSLLTGFLPHETHIEAGQLPEGVDTLAEILGRRGFRTAAVVSNFVLRRGTGFEQGFDSYDDEMDQLEKRRRWPERTADHTTERAIERLRELRDGPFFLWVHYQDPHGPYTPPEAYGRMFRDAGLPPRLLKVNRGISGQGGIPGYQVIRGIRDFNFYRAEYDGEVRFVDDGVGRLLDAVRDLGLERSTLVVLTADHGESMGERDQYFVHMRYLYDELTRVPLVLKLGDSLRGRRADTVQLADILPTVLARVGAPADERLRGRDLLADASDPREVLAEIPRAHHQGTRISLSVGRERLIETRPDEGVELYDLAADPGETRNLADDPAHAARRDALRARLAALFEEDRLRVAPGPPRHLERDVREKLRALGYVR